MSYYDNQQWSSTVPGGQTSWEQQTPPARSGASSAVPREDSGAFQMQIEEVDRAVDNLTKSSNKMGFNPQGRRDSMPLSAGPPPREFSQQFDPRMGGGPPRHHSSNSGFGDSRSFSGSNLQDFYASQRHQPSRGANEADQVMQARRRMAAQREKELRNYHQEQQYNRNIVADPSPFGAKPADRTMSPGSGMGEDERRELIARQRRDLYGDGSAYGEASFDENGTPRPGTQGSGSHSATGLRGHSPLAFDHFTVQSNNQDQQTQEPQSATQGPGQQRSRANSTSSPSSNPASSFSLFESAAQQSSRTSTSSPGGSPPRQGKAPTSSGVAPIGTRPNIAVNPALNKARSTTPLPSPLSYGYAANDDTNDQKDLRSTSAASNSNSQGNLQGGWSGKNAVWGTKPLGVPASVWG